MMTPQKRPLGTWVSPSPRRFSVLPWSYTKLSQAVRCPLALYLNCIRPKTEWCEAPPKTQIGVDLHQYAHILEAGGTATIRIPDGVHVPPEYFSNLGKFFVEIAPQLKQLVGQSPRVLAEIHLHVDNRLYPTSGYMNSYLSGIMDYLVYSPETKRAIIVDYKTGNQPFSPAALESATQQLHIYSLLVHKGMFPLNGIGLMVYPLETGEPLWLTNEIEDFNYSDELTRLTNLVTEATARMTNEPTKAVRNPLCPYCNHRDICPIYGKQHE